MLIGLTKDAYHFINKPQPWLLSEAEAQPQP